MYEEEMEGFNLKDEIVNGILMHRDAHFGGQFQFMIDYYEKEGKGSLQEFTLEKIREVESIERQLGENLAALLLSGPEAEQVKASKEMYKKLRDVYESKDQTDRYAQLIADLILAEEEDPEKEMQAIVAEKAAIVPALVQLLRSEEFYNPLFPGYGQAPLLVIRCLGEIGDKRAIMSLFEFIGRSEVLDEESSLRALRAIGTPAKEFLLKALRSRPITEDNERAAIALIHFKDDPDIAKACLEMVKDPAIRKIVPLSVYLVLACEGLQEVEDRKAFRALLDDGATPSILKTDIKSILKLWE